MIPDPSGQLAELVVLGLLLFLIYINDMVYVSTQLSLYQLLMIPI